jgi:hypothetical protein
MNHVERFRAVMNFGPVDRLPIIEWAPWWDKTIARWRGEGLPANLTDEYDIRAHFGLDPVKQFWFNPRAKTIPPKRSPEENRVNKPEDYLALRQHLFPADAVERDEIRPWAEMHARGEVVVWITFEGFFWFPRGLLGIEQHLYAFYDQPELMHRMNEDLLQSQLRILDEFCPLIRPEFMTFAEDMSYNHGPMLSKAMFDEFLAPYYRRIVPRLKEYGIIPLVDSDGDVTQLIPWLKEVGIEGLLPLERMAGVDAATLRRDHPRFGMIGAFDKTVMHRGEPAIRAEFERLLPVMRGGGFVPSVDHQTPPEVSIDQYRQYLGILCEYAEKGRPG